MGGTGEWRRQRAPTAVHLLVAGIALVVVTTLAVLLVPRGEAVGDVDAIVVLGGGAGERLALGRALAGARDVPLVLSAEAIAVGDTEGLTCAIDVVCLYPEPVTTAGEARTMRDLADTRDWDRVAAVTSSFHANRARMLFRQCLGDRVDVVGAPGTTTFPREVYRYGREAFARIAGATHRRAC